MPSPHKKQTSKKFHQVVHSSFSIKIQLSERESVSCETSRTSETSGISGSTKSGEKSFSSIWFEISAGRNCLFRNSSTQVYVFWKGLKVRADAKNASRRAFFAFFCCSSFSSCSHWFMNRILSHARSLSFFCFFIKRRICCFHTYSSDRAKYSCDFFFRSQSAELLFVQFL